MTDFKLNPEACVTAIRILQESRNRDGTVNDSIVLIGDSYRWLADKVCEYSTMDSDYMALASNELEKIGEALDKATGVLK